jgi:Cystatin domain
MPLVGGYSDDKQADSEISELFNTDSVKQALGNALGSTVSEVEVLTYKVQVVAGLNYKVHCKVDGKGCHFQAFKPLPHTGRK